MNEKGQDIIATSLEAIVGIIVLSVLIGALWPLADNFLNLTGNIPNYSLFRPLANFLPAIVFIIFIIVVIRKATGTQQQRQ